MLRRKIYDDLLNWKRNNNKKVLLVKGARQVGKTFIIEEFCKNNYDNFIEINFFETNDYKKIFEGNLDVETILKEMSLYVKNFRLINDKTVIFLDEIQECPRAITALKFLSMDKRFDVIASGSLLGLNYKEEIPSYPVGYIEHLEMHGLDFEEFLWANGIQSDAINYLKELFDKKEVIPVSVHDKMMSLFKEYIVVGGMPEVVNVFVNEHNFNTVLKLQRDIIESYKMDIGKYAKDNDKAKIRECFLSIPRQLSQENKKFKYKLVESSGKANKYRGSLEWLFDANIITFCHNLKNLEAPLEGNSVDNVFKVYMRDTGLLLAMLEDGSQKEIIEGNLGIYKGAIYENIIADVFTKLGKKLYYYSPSSSLEIDFVIRYENEICVVEVKSADNTKSKSIKNVMAKKMVKKGIKLSAKNIGSNSLDVISIPLYMAIFL